MSLLGRVHYPKVTRILCFFRFAYNALRICIPPKINAASVGYSISKDSLSAQMHADNLRKECHSKRLPASIDFFQHSELAVWPLCIVHLFSSCLSTKSTHFRFTVCHSRCSYFLRLAPGLERSPPSLPFLCCLCVWEGGCAMRAHLLNLRFSGLAMATTALPSSAFRKM